jgi:4-amino-4-deoxy-L-arabinose transferase-like glycosyltransferase
LHPADASRTDAHRLRDFLAIAAVAGVIALLSIHRLDAADVCGANEAVEGVFLQQMVEHGALLFPVENGRAPMYKPPLFHWTATALDRVAGIKKVTSFNLRITSALYATAGGLLTMGFAYGLLGPSAAVLSGLILAASYQYIEEARIGRVDMTLCFFETLALFAFIWWYAPIPRTSRASPASNAPLMAPHARSNAIRYLFATALGLGVLAKGPVGAILPALACGIFLIAEHRLRDLRALATPGPVLLAFAVGSSWYVACLLGQRYGFLNRQIGSENFGRFFGALGSMAPWYYVKPLLLNSAPLSLLVPIAVFYALRTYFLNPHSDPLIPLPDLGEGERATARAGEGASASVPPPVVGDGEGASDSNSLSHRDGQRALIAAHLLAIFWIVTVTFFTIAAYKRRAYLLPLWPAAAVILAWWLQELTRGRWGRVLRDAIALVCLALVIFNFNYIPRREVRDCGDDSFREAAAEINRIVGSDEPLYIYGLSGEPAPLLFYLDRHAPPIAGKLGDAPPGYIIVPADVWNEKKDEALDLTPVMESTSGRPRLVLLRHGKAYAIR